MSHPSRSLVVSFAIVLTLLAGYVLTGSVKAVSAGTPVAGSVGIRPTVDVPATQFSGTADAGRIGGQAVEGMSRQPEAAGNIQTAMIISAALIEGATFFALIVCMLFNS